MKNRWTVYKPEVLNDIRIMDEKSSEVARLCWINSASKSYAGINKKSEANAARIVKAMNRDHFFDELVAALEDAIDGLGFTPTSYEELLTKIKAVK